jgi:hypothetical protein
VIGEILEKQKELRKQIYKGEDPFESSNPRQRGEIFYHLIQAMRQELSEAQDEIYWKWWSVEGKDLNKKFTFRDKSKAFLELIDTLHFLIDGFALLGASEDQIMDVYRKKWKANMFRQASGYSVDNKTEEDNECIEKQMKLI